MTTREDAAAGRSTSVRRIVAAVIAAGLFMTLSVSTTVEAATSKCSLDVEFRTATSECSGGGFQHRAVTRCKTWLGKDTVVATGPWVQSGTTIATKSTAKCPARNIAYSTTVEKRYLS